VQTGQHVPTNIGETVRCIFESLALRYRQVLDNLKELSANPIDVLHVIGGGSKNDLLNQFTASATGVSVVAGPSEATAIGNIMVQAVASGAVESVAAVRKSLSKSSELKQYEPQDTEAWKAGYERFKTVIR
jgi:rhamnulokinase